MIVRILSCAEAEIVEAVAYYNDQCPGLGFEFAAEAKATLGRIADFPDAWPPFSLRSRRCLLNRFPYGILYCQHQDEILVLAVMHLKRASKHWRTRLRDTLGKSGGVRRRRTRRR
jgi:hypothetical protein